MADVVEFKPQKARGKDSSLPQRCWMRRAYLWTHFTALGRDIWLKELVKWLVKPSRAVPNCHNRHKLSLRIEERKQELLTV